MIIDSRAGGFGDVWMRLLALYTLTHLRGRERHTMLIKPALVAMARALFGERIEIGHDGEGDVIYTPLGLRHLIGGVCTGKSYVLSFYWLMRIYNKHVTLKHRINDVLILSAARMGLIHLTDPAKIADYAGYMELTALRPFSEVHFEEFSRQSASDLPELQLRLGQLGSNIAPKSDKVIVYPSGTAHQVMPVPWAQKHLKEAVFVFHSNDPYAIEFENGNLNVEKFDSLDGLLNSGFGARRIICTDSFPSHFWQVYMRDVFLLMTQQIPRHVVHPGFPKSQVLLSRASCCPCPNKARGTDNTPCDEGHPTCLSWDDPAYEKAFDKMG